MTRTPLRRSGGLIAAQLSGVLGTAVAAEISVGMYYSAAWSIAGAVGLLLMALRMTECRGVHVVGVHDGGNALTLDRPPHYRRNIGVPIGPLTQFDAECEEWCVRAQERSAERWGKLRRVSPMARKEE